MERRRYHYHFHTWLEKWKTLANGPTSEASKPLPTCKRDPEARDGLSRPSSTTEKVLQCRNQQGDEKAHRTENSTARCLTMLRSLGKQLMYRFKGGESITSLRLRQCTGQERAQMNNMENVLNLYVLGAKNKELGSHISWISAPLLGGNGDSKTRPTRFPSHSSGTPNLMPSLELIHLV